MSRSVPHFEEHLAKMFEIHRKKGQDYATYDDPLLNYHRQQQVMAWFDSNEDKVWVGHIIQKLSRIANLRNQKIAADKAGLDYEPKNESLKDSFKDLCTITNLWWCDWELLYQAPRNEDNPPASEVLEDHRRPLEFDEDRARPDILLMRRNLIQFGVSPEEAEYLRDAINLAVIDRRTSDA